MLSCNTYKTPMDINIKLISNIESEPTNITTCYHIISKLFYLINSRPNISYIVGVFNRFMTNSLQIHLEATKGFLDT